MTRLLVWSCGVRWRWVARAAKWVLVEVKLRPLGKVMQQGTVRDLERLEAAYRAVGLPGWADCLRDACGGDYARFVLKRDSPDWAEVR
jgi:hypothetical protein